MNSLERLIGILDIFEEEPGIFTAEQLHERLGYTRSTLYRYLKTLADAGLLTSFHGEGFMLGPRVIELHAAMIKRDPLILSSRPVMQMLSRQFKGVSLLCRRFRDKVLCVHQEAVNDDMPTCYQIGMPRSLVHGAASRVILANLGPSHVRRIYDDHAQAFSAAGIGEDLLNVRRHLRRIRERGYDIGSGEVNGGITAIAAPVLDGGANVIGSLCISVPQAKVPADQITAIAEEVMQAAEAVGHAIAA